MSDAFTPELISAAKALAVKSGPRIRPIEGDLYAMWVSPYQAMCMEVVEKFHGRDRRRIKRELRKGEQRIKRNEHCIRLPEHSGEDGRSEPGEVGG